MAVKRDHVGRWNRKYGEGGSLSFGMESGGLSVKWLEEDGCPAVEASQEGLDDW